jgi:hypothetical protein
MPVLRNVVKADTLEIQRQKINQLAQDVFDLGGGGGGSLSGTFSLSNGTRSAPSLFFTNQTNTGLFKNGNVLSVTSYGQEVTKFDTDRAYFYKGVKLQSPTIDTVTVATQGRNYYARSYENIAVTGGSGTAALFDLVVDPFSGTISNAGTGYRAGIYTDVPMSNGSGSGATANITVRGIVGSITNPGSGYTSLTYTDVPLSGGSGTGARATLVVSGDVVTEVTITNSGTGYVNGNTLSVLNSDLIIPPSSGGGTSGGSGFIFTINQIPYIVTSVTPTSNGINGYAVGDILSASNTVIGASTPVGTISNAGSGYTASTYNNVSLYNIPTTTYTITSVSNPGTPPPNNVYAVNGNTQQTLTLIRGNTYRFDLSSASNDTHPFVIRGNTGGPLPSGVFYFTNGNPGTAGAFVDLVILPTASTGTTLRYDCAAHPEMGATITVNTGTAGRYGYGAKAQVVVSSGVVSSFTITTAGYNYKATDTVSVLNSSVGGTGSGLVYTINTASTGSGSGFTYTLSGVGNISSASTRSDGVGYQLDDLLVPSIPFTYKVQCLGLNNTFKYWIDKNDGLGYVEAPVLTLYRGYTYIFDYSDSSNLSHLFQFNLFPDGNRDLGTGVVYTSGVVSDTVNKTISITISADTLSTFYYHCGVQTSIHANEGNTINVVSGTPTTLTVGNISVATISQTDKVTLSLDGTASLNSLTANSSTLQSATISSNATIGNISISGNSIVSTSNAITLNPVTNLNITGGSGKSFIVNNGTSNIFTVNLNTAELTTEGNIILPATSLNYISINEKLKLSNTLIQEIVDVPLTGNGVGITLQPDSNKSVFVNATSSLKIPSGTTLQRPLDAATGSIRFNTTVGQYEGYNATGSSWSSLGGVRDVDGNTYIIPELSSGANDDTFYFYNGGKNTLQLSEVEFNFREVNTISSSDLVGVVPWQITTTFTINTLLYAGDNVYEVTVAGTSGNSVPSHTSGTATNGSLTLLWLRNKYGALTFANSTRVNFNVDVYYSDKLKISSNIISSTDDDIVITPFAGKKLNISGSTSLVLPSGTTLQRGNPSTGSIRYSTSFTQFEGYNGTNWTSLGGVRDVDGNTYIIPESSPGANENILYFYNNASNTLQLTSNALNFESVDTITSTNNNLDFNVDTITFSNLALTIDNSNASISKILSTKTNLDLALSSGLTTDPLIRLNNTGDIYINKSYSTGSNTFIKVLDNELKTFELDDVKILTSELTLTKGSTDFGLSTIYNPTTESGAKIVVIANNTNTNDREIIEYNITSKNGDIFHNEFGNVITGPDQLNNTFDFDPSGNVRMTSTISSGLTSGNVVQVTVIRTIFKL